MILVLVKAIFYFLLLDNTSSSLLFCDEKLNICLFSNQVKATLEESRNQCRQNMGILLEIYDENYQSVVDQAFRTWKAFNGDILWLNIVKVGQRVQWFDTGRRVTYSKWEGEANGPSACIRFEHNASVWQSYWSITDTNLFMCLQNSSQSISQTMQTTTLNPETTPVIFNTTTTITTTTTSNSSENLVLVGAVVGTFLVLILVVASLLLIYCFIKKKKKTKTQETENRTDQIPSPFGSTLNSSDAIFYIGRKRTLSGARKKHSNLYVDDTLSHIIRYHKPPELNDEPPIYDTITSLSDIISISNSADDNENNTYYSEEFHV